jgi:hypothetical protein
VGVSQHDKPMKKFELFFPKEIRHAMDEEAEIAFRGKSAYVCVVDPFDDGSGQQSLVKSKGRILLYHEAMSADGCRGQIDSLISDLRRLKIEARKKSAE